MKTVIELRSRFGQKITVSKVLDFLKFFFKIENDAAGLYRFE